MHSQWLNQIFLLFQSLLEGLDTLDQESCKGFANAQRNWIGETTGVRVNVRLQVSGSIQASLWGGCIDTDVSNIAASP